MCSKCFNVLPFSSFYKDKSSKFGIGSHCKECKNNSTRLLREMRKSRDTIEVAAIKICPGCRVEKDSSAFCRQTSNKDGLSSYCKQCRKNNDRRQREYKLLHSLSNSINDDFKKCHKCSLEKSVAEFAVNHKSNDHRSYICNDCKPKSQWTKEKQRVSERNYRLRNIEKIKEKYRKQGKSIYRRIKNSIRARLVGSIQRKNNKTLEYLGCSTVFFRSWIESLFCDDMSWENYGKWHLDHVRPCSSFDLANKSDIMECFHWKNYQPLSAIQNLLKSCTIDTELIENHYRKAHDFEKLHLKNFSAQVKECELTGTP